MIVACVQSSSCHISCSGPNQHISSHQQPNHTGDGRIDCHLVAVVGGVDASIICSVLRRRRNAIVIGGSVWAPVLIIGGVIAALAHISTSG